MSVRLAHRIQGPAAAGAGQVDDPLIRRRLSREARLAGELRGPDLRAGDRVVSGQHALEVDRENAAVVVGRAGEVVEAAEFNRAPVDRAGGEVECEEPGAGR